MDKAEKGRPVLARYDFRTKQQYIYRTNTMKEIAGASTLITDAWDDFLNLLAAPPKNWSLRKNYEYIPEGRYYRNLEAEPFEPDLQKNHGEVIYVGGGNLYMLWRDRETALEANRILSGYLRDATYSLSPVCGIAEYTGDYAEDIRKLNEDFERMKGLTPPVSFTAVLPFTQTDRKTGFPIVAKSYKGDLSMESLKKLNKYGRDVETRSGDYEKNLDNLVTEKGTESLLAVIYIDGNNMGARVGAAMKPEGKILKEYREAVPVIRGFSNAVQKNFVTDPRNAILEMLKEKREKEERKGCRFVIAGGDEMTLVCNARDALDIVRTYFDSLRRGDGGESGNTACAGICVFHSHYPFSTAYAVAEECCENAKKKNRETGGDNCLIDFQHCFGGNIGSLEAMRSRDSLDGIGRPYLYGRYCGADGSPDAKCNDFGDLLKSADKLKKIGRRNIKNLSTLRITDKQAYEVEVRRLRTRFPDADIDETDGKFLHDIAQFYDIWFAKEGEQNG